MSGPPATTPAIPRFARVYACGGVAWMLVYALFANRGLLAADLLYQVPVTATLVVMGRVALDRGMPDRRFWVWLAPGVAFWCLGDTLWAVFELAGLEPTPSPADACYVVGMLLVVVAMAHGMRERSWLRSARALLDAGVLAAAILTIGVVLVVLPEASGDVDAALLLALAYNALDVLCVVPAVLLLVAAGRGVRLGIALVSAALVVGAAADAGYTWLEATGSYASGNLLDVVWIANYVLTGVGGLIALRARPAATAPAAQGERDVGLPLLLGGFTALAGFWGLRGGSAVGAVVALALVAVLARLLLTARDNSRMVGELAERTRSALVDPVTGVYTRVAFEDLLRRDAAAPGARLSLIAIELDAGGLPLAERDAAMAEAADRLRAVAGPSVVAGRTGAHELVVLVPGGEPLRATAERLRSALAREPFSAGPLGACVGAAAAPLHASTADELLGAALAARELARDLGGNQVRTADDELGLPLLETLADEVDERRGRPGHSHRVSRWAAAVACELGLDREAQGRFALAGRVHDLALVAAPEALLLRPHPPGRGNDPRLGEHPVAALRLAPRVQVLLGDAVVAHLAPLDDEMPLVTRVVSVCNVWATLREGRPGRPPLDVASARAHLLSGSGTTYSPDAVRAFLQLEARGEITVDEERPAVSPAASAGAILTAVASAPSPSAGAAAPSPAPRGRRPAILLAAALTILAAWTATAVVLQVQAGAAKRRAVALVKADRHLQELELLAGRTMSGELTAAQAAIIGRTHEQALDRAAREAGPSAPLRAALDALTHSGEVMGRAVARGDADAIAAESRRIDHDIKQVDKRIDVDINEAQRVSDRDSAFAWRFGAGSGVLAVLAAVVLLVAFWRMRRAAGRLRVAAARAEGERAALRDSDRRFRALVRHASDSVLVTAADGTIAFATDTVAPLLGWAPAELVGRPAAELVDSEDRDRLADLMRAARRMPDATAGELTLRHRDGDAVAVDLRVSDRLEDPDVGGVVLTIRDVTERRRLARELRRSGLVDARTGLANRARFEGWLHDGLARSADVAVILVDLDDLASVNESLGHRAGDQVLISWAERLRAALGDEGRLARLSGDEFGVLLEGVTELGTAEQVARRLLEASGGAVIVDGVALPVTASAGVALAAPGDLAEDVLRAADTAAHAARSGGAGRVGVYSPSMHARARRRMELRAALAGAVEREELAIAYQPIAEVASGAPVGVEALLRWRTPEGEPVSPADFIPIAEATGLIVPLGAWVLRRACGAVAPLGDLYVAVNVSAVQLRDGGFVEDVAAALRGSALAPERLVIELTESALMDDVDAAHRAFSALRELGVRVAIDDFGTGFSSLATLAGLPVDVLKLDRSFIAAMSDSAPHAALVGGVVSLADRLGLPLVAEGVETEEQLEALRDLGCAFAQGYHLGRPGPLAAVDGRTRSLR